MFTFFTFWFTCQLLVSRFYQKTKSYGTILDRSVKLLKATPNNTLNLYSLLLWIHRSVFILAVRPFIQGLFWFIFIAGRNSFSPHIPIKVCPTHWGKSVIHFSGKYWDPDFDPKIWFWRFRNIFPDLLEFFLKYDFPENFIYYLPQCAYRTEKRSSEMNPTLANVLLGKSQKLQLQRRRRKAKRACMWVSAHNGHRLTVKYSETLKYWRLKSFEAFGKPVCIMGSKMAHKWGHWFMAYLTFHQLVFVELRVSCQSF